MYSMTSIMVFAAHPDDESAMLGTLWNFFYFYKFEKDINITNS